ncbi:MAG: sulfatase-like hydrolase/transferase [Lentisphaeraceae bacterium]|nr:sulfatase-like hydrolase/transferase [Lentisphaeraceae bacterium]
MKFLLATFLLFFSIVLYADKPNIVWICVEDASPHISCYGEKAIQTPNIDKLASQGVRFEKAFVTAPVCSASRSAMITGMFQTTSGFLHHRSQKFSGKGGGNKAYFESYKTPAGIKTLPEIFKEHGYYTSNAKKTDYNFESGDIYDSTKDWSGRKKGQPFFAQFQLKGGKGRKSDKGVDRSKMQLPPYYPNTEIMRDDWAHYLGSWLKVDEEVKNILGRLQNEGELENTYVFFWTDHGVSHIRGKQFLYDEGIQVPLIVRFPNKLKSNTLRKDMVSHIDIPVTSLVLAGIEVPSYMQGQSIFADDYKEQTYIYTARDRCDETVDIIRSVRTQKYKYIRNFLPHCSHMQRSQYKEGKKIVQEAKKLYKEGKLNELQARAFQPTRPVEELYDLENDPYETLNLAAKETHKETLLALRNKLKNWMINTGDLGLIPEPILEDLGKQNGSKYAVLKNSENKSLVSDLLNIIEAGEEGSEAKILAGIKSERSEIRYWAVKAIGNLKIKSLKSQVERLLKDPNPSVRVSAAESIAQFGEFSKASAVLNKELFNSNLLVGLYAIRTLETIGLPVRAFVKENIKKALKSKYEFTRRVAKRLMKEWEI